MYRGRAGGSGNARSRARESKAGRKQSALSTTRILSPEVNPHGCQCSDRIRHQQNSALSGQLHRHSTAPTKYIFSFHYSNSTRSRILHISRKRLHHLRLLRRHGLQGIELGDHVLLPLLDG